MSDCEREWRSESRLLAPGLFAYQAHGSKWAVGPAVRRVFYCVSGVRNHICNAVGETVDSEFFGATGAAKDQASYFHAVTDNTNAAMLTDRRQRLNRTFEAIEHMRDVIASHFETFVVVISASFTLRHDRSLIEILMEVIPDLVAPTRTSGEDLPLIYEVQEAVLVACWHFLRKNSQSLENAPQRSFGRLGIHFNAPD